MVSGSSGCIWCWECRCRATTAGWIGSQRHGRYEIRYPNKDDGYNVRIRIDSGDSIEVALTLLGLAVARIEG